MNSSRSRCCCWHRRHLRKTRMLRLTFVTVRRPGQTAKGEMVYALDCKALKAENKDVNYSRICPRQTCRRR